MGDAEALLLRDQRKFVLLVAACNQERSQTLLDGGAHLQRTPAG